MLTQCSRQCQILAQSNATITLLETHKRELEKLKNLNVAENAALLAQLSQKQQEIDLLNEQVQSMQAKLDLIAEVCSHRGDGEEKD